MLARVPEFMVLGAVPTCTSGLGTETQTAHFSAIAVALYVTHREVCAENHTTQDS